jgi:hypothetical protein
VPETFAQQQRSRGFFMAESWVAKLLIASLSARADSLLFFDREKPQKNREKGHPDLQLFFDRITG